MKLRTGQLPTPILAAVAVLAIIIITAVLTIRVRDYTPGYDLKYEAARRARSMMELIKQERIERGAMIDPVNDPNQTGLIGLSQSLITTEFGDLNSKLTTLNPNFAAVIVDLLLQAGVRPDESVAVSFSGSFPALNISVMASLETLKLKPVIITSVGSSMWGANDPAFTYLDMEKTLFERQYIKYRSVSASIGGIDDIGRGLSPEGRALISQAIKRCSRSEICVADLESSVQQRMTIYAAHTGITNYRIFINVGGGAAALGGSEVPSGVVEPNQYILNRGVAGAFLRAGVTVINLSDINRLARRYHLPLSPTPLPVPGSGKIFYEIRYSTTLAAASAILMLIIIFVILRIDIYHYWQRLFITRRNLP